MTNAAAKMFVSFLESSDMNYSIVNEETAIIRVGWNLEGTRISIYFQFDQDCKSVHIVGNDFMSFSADKIEKMYKIMNDCNQKYRWVKFTVDASDNTAAVECDAVIQLDTCAEEVTELMLRMVKIVENAYPIMMKALWA